MLANLLNRTSKIKLKKDASKYKKTCNLKANTEASNVQTFYKRIFEGEFQYSSQPYYVVLKLAPSLSIATVVVTTSSSSSSSKSYNDLP